MARVFDNCSECGGVNGSKHCYCKPCYNEWNRSWRLRNLERERSNEAREAMQRRRANPEAHKAKRLAWETPRRDQILTAKLAERRLKAYGVTQEQYDSMYVAQSGLCAICKLNAVAASRGTRKNLAVDHDHETGSVRGLLCCRCNRAIGLLSDSVDTLLAAVEYLSRHSA